MQNIKIIHSQEDKPAKLFVLQFILSLMAKEEGLQRGAGLAALLRGWSLGT